MMDSLTENIRKEAPWQIMCVDDVVLCAREKYVLELELKQWRDASEKNGMKVSRANTKYITFVPEWNAIGMQSDQLPHVTEFKYMVSTLQSDGDMNTEETRGRSMDIPSILEEDVRHPMRQESTTTREGKDPQY